MTDNVFVFQQAKDSADARQMNEMMHHAREAFVAFEDVYRGLRASLEDMSEDDLLAFRQVCCPYFNYHTADLDQFRAFMAITEVVGGVMAGHPRFGRSAVAQASAPGEPAA